MLHKFNYFSLHFLDNVFRVEEDIDALLFPPTSGSRVDWSRKEGPNWVTSEGSKCSHFPEILMCIWKIAIFFLSFLLYFNCEHSLAFTDLNMSLNVSCFICSLRFIISLLSVNSKIIIDIVWEIWTRKRREFRIRHSIQIILC